MIGSVELSGSATGTAAGQAVLDESVKRLLDADEDLLVAVEVRPLGPVKKWLVPCIDINPPLELELPKRMALAATPKRLILASVSGAVVDQARKLLFEIPVAQVDAVEYRGGWNGSTVTWTAEGRAWTATAGAKHAN